MENAQTMLKNLQAQKQKLQQITVHKQNLIGRQKEIKSALEELKSTNKEVYKSVGPLVVKKDKDKISKELNENLDEIKATLKKVSKQEDTFTKKVREGQKSIQELMSKAQTQ